MNGAVATSGANEASMTAVPVARRAGSYAGRRPRCRVRGAVPGQTCRAGSEVPCRVGGAGFALFMDAQPAPSAGRLP
jgi:hypothetical protein